MGSRLLGPIVELLVRTPRGIESHAPAGRWLEWDPGTERLHAVRRGERIGDASSEDAAWLDRWHWQAQRAGQYQTSRPTGRGRRVGELAGVVYLARKGRQLAEWHHDFSDPPEARLGADREWRFFGRVVCDSRGIVS